MLGCHALCGRGVVMGRNNWLPKVSVPSRPQRWFNAMAVIGTGGQVEHRCCF